MCIVWLFLMISAITNVIGSMGYTETNIVVGNYAGNNIVNVHYEIGDAFYEVDISNYDHSFDEDDIGVQVYLITENKNGEVKQYVMSSGEYKGSSIGSGIYTIYEVLMILVFLMLFIFTIKGYKHYVQDLYLLYQEYNSGLLIDRVLNAQQRGLLVNVRIPNIYYNQSYNQNNYF